ncbi:hypothetical protein [Dolichospermum sp. LEGE 00246]|uniref:hypothetical protein n=1 Tax=Dolichospermum TaxID=748770 RepID=UPI00351CA174
MILINAEQLSQRWQGSDAIEEIGRLLPVVACNYKYSGLQTRHFPAHIICN